VHLSGRQKVAIYLLSLDTQTAVQIINSFSPEDIQLVTQEMLGLKDINGEVLQQVIDEFEQRMASGKPQGLDSSSAAVERLLEAAVGPDRAREVLSNRGPKGPRRPPFESLNDMEEGQLVALLRGEHPQVIAVVLSYLHPPLAAAVLSGLPDEIHTDVVSRITKADSASHELLTDIELLLCQRADAVADSGTTKSASNTYKSVAEILNMVGKDIRNSVLSHLNDTDPEIAQEVENMMFVFEDLSGVDDRSMQKILREVDNQTLSLALKSASDEIKEKVFNNLSKRAAETMREEMALMGPKPISDVEGAQREMLEVARRLDDAGEITLRQSEQEAMV